MLACEPDTAFRTAFPQRLDITIELHLPVFRQVAGLEHSVRTPAGQFIILPIRGEDGGRFAIRRRGGVVRQAGVVWREEGVETRVVFLGGRVEAVD